jgi:RNA polymerase sigma-70 factor, ECF subfamily
MRLGRRDPLPDPAPLIRRVYAYAAYRLGDGPDAEDVTSETMERAIRYRSSYDPSRGEPVMWLLGIARRYFEEQRAGLATGAELPETPAPGVLEDDVVRRLELADAVSSLPGRDRDLVALRYGSDLTARQIGELLGLGTNAVEVALHHALGRLRDSMAAEPEAGAVRVLPTSEVQRGMKDFREFETQLRAARPEPRSELVRTLEDRARPARRAVRPSPRIVLAAVLTAGFVAALAPAGGLGYAANALGHASHAVNHTVTAVRHPTSTHGHDVDPHHVGAHHADPHQDFHPTSAHHEHGIPICHFDHDHFESLRVSDDVLAFHLRHPHDIIPAPPGGCP